MSQTTFKIQFDREEDGRWIAEVPRVPGALAYGKTKIEAKRRVTAIALRTLADQVESGASPKGLSNLFSYGAMASG